jgi:hypothetical protein
VYHLTLLGLLLTFSLFLAAATNSSLQSVSGEFDNEEPKKIERNLESAINDNYPDYLLRDEKDQTTKFLNDNMLETNSIDKSSGDIPLEDFSSSSDLSSQPIICTESGLIVDNGDNCPSQCLNGYFVMNGIACNDVGNPIQCEGTEIVVTDPSDCPKKCIGGDFNGFFVKEKKECKTNIEKEDINFELCTSRLVVDNVSYCPVKCVTGQFHGLYVMDARECNWPTPNIQICDNGFVINNFIANCPVKCVTGQFNGLYVMDLKECNNIETAITPSISPLSSSASPSDFSLFDHSLLEEENREGKFMKGDEEEPCKDDTNRTTKKLMEHTIIPQSKEKRSNECIIVLVMDK